MKNLIIDLLFAPFIGMIIFAVLVLPALAFDVVTREFASQIASFGPLSLLLAFIGLILNYDD